jgi:hypothetical protein
MAAFGGDANVLATNAISTNLSHQSRNASMPSIGHVPGSGVTRR